MKEDSHSYQLISKFGFKFLLNQSFIPYLDLKEIGHLRTLSSYKKFIDEFVNNLPDYDALILRLPPNFRNPLPFIWNDFEVKTRFTFQLNLKQSQPPFESYKSSLKRHIRSAEKNLTIKESSNTELLFELKNLDHEKRGVPLDFSKEGLQSYFKDGQKNKSLKVYEAYADGVCVGSLLLWFQQHTAYYLIGAIHPEHRKSKALTLLLHHAIEEAQKRATVFDFEGSMEPGIARFFSTFGAQITPYYQVEHYPNKLAKMALKAKKLMG